MATKLKNLMVSKVDFVDQGANPDAHIRIFKRNDPVSESTAGKDLVAPKSIGGEKSAGVLKKLLGFIGKAAGVSQEEIDSAIEGIQKGGATSFRERFNEARNRKIADEIWDICYALQSSLCSILNDEDLDGAGASAAMQESLNDFHTVVNECIGKWSEGSTSNVVSKKEDLSLADVELMKSARDRLVDAIEKVSAEQEPITNKEGEQEMGLKIDKSRMTPAEVAFLESIEKRYGTEEGDGDPSGAGDPAPGGQVSVPPVAKSAVADLNVPAAQTVGEPPTEPAGDDIYKGLHPEVKAELEALRKFREAEEDKELRGVAKRYTIIGRKEEELVPMLKSLKAAGGTAYNDMIAILDQSVAMVEKSGAFSEIGKSGHGMGGFAEAKIEGIAKKYVEQNPTMSYAEALAKAWEANPAIMAEYDEEAGF